MSRRGWMLLIVLGVIWGAPYLMIRVAVASVDPLIVAIGRTLIGSLLLLPLALHRGVLAPAFRRWQALLAFTLVEISGPWLLLGHAETRINSSTAGLLLAIIPMLSAVIVAMLGHERLEGRRLAGLVIGFAGVAILVGLDIRMGELLAVGAMALCALGYAVGPIIIDRKLKGVPPLGVITASLIVATVLYAPIAPLVWPDSIPAPAALSIAGLGVMCTAVAFLLFFALIAEIGPARATLVAYINPAVAILLGALALSEPLTLGMAIGFPLVLLGTVMGTGR
jgi:drug/metabolite transporter (DMT)-like permease